MGGAAALLTDLLRLTHARPDLAVAVGCWQLYDLWEEEEPATGDAAPGGTPPARRSPSPARGGPAGGGAADCGALSGGAGGREGQGGGRGWLRGAGTAGKNGPDAPDAAERESSESAIRLGLTEEGSGEGIRESEVGANFGERAVCRRGESRREAGEGPSGGGSGGGGGGGSGKVGDGRSGVSAEPPRTPPPPPRLSAAELLRQFVSEAQVAGFPGSAAAASSGTPPSSGSEHTVQFGSTPPSGSASPAAAEGEIYLPSTLIFRRRIAAPGRQGGAPRKIERLEAAEGKAESDKSVSNDAESEAEGGSCADGGQRQGGGGRAGEQSETERAGRGSERRKKVDWGSEAAENSGCAPSGGRGGSMRPAGGAAAAAAPVELKVEVTNVEFYPGRRCRLRAETQSGRGKNCWVAPPSTTVLSLVTSVFAPLTEAGSVGCGAEADDGVAGAAAAAAAGAAAPSAGAAAAAAGAATVAAGACGVGGVRGGKRRASSRYAREFFECGSLGAGGFGSVTKCRWALEGRGESSAPAGPGPGRSSTLFAVKRIPLSADARQDAALLREAANLALLQHPNIVRYYSAWVEDGGTPAGNDGPAPPRTLFIQMEYCSGRTLRSAINGTSKDRFFLHQHHDLCWSLFRQIVDGLSCIHAHGFVHRDLKPCNVFLQPAPDRAARGGEPVGARNASVAGAATQAVVAAEIARHLPGGAGRSPPPPTPPTTAAPALACSFTVKIGDFGLTKSFTNQRGPYGGGDGTPAGLSSSGDLGDASEDPAVLSAGVGTKAYMAPEQELGGAYDCKADMFSLGVLFFEMWRPPFDTAMERAVVLANLRRGEIDPAYEAAVPAGVIDILHALLDRDPRNRPSAAQLLENPRLLTSTESARLFAPVYDVLRRNDMSLEVSRAAAAVLARQLLAGGANGGPAAAGDAAGDATGDAGGGGSGGSGTGGRAPPIGHLPQCSFYHSMVAARATDAFRLRGALQVPAAFLKARAERSVLEESRGFDGRAKEKVFLDRWGTPVTLQRSLTAGLAPVTNAVLQDRSVGRVFSLQSFPTVKDGAAVTIIERPRAAFGIATSESLFGAAAAEVAWDELEGDAAEQSCGCCTEGRGCSTAAGGGGGRGCANCSDSTGGCSRRCSADSTGCCGRDPRPPLVLGFADEISRYFFDSQVPRESVLRGPHGGLCSRIVFPPEVEVACLAAECAAAGLTSPEDEIIFVWSLGILLPAIIYALMQLRGGRRWGGESAARADAAAGDSCFALALRLGTAAALEPLPAPGAAGGGSQPSTAHVKSQLLKRMKAALSRTDSERGAPGAPAEPPFDLAPLADFFCAATAGSAAADAAAAREGAPRSLRRWLDTIPLIFGAEIANFLRPFAQYALQLDWALAETLPMYSGAKAVYALNPGFGGPLTGLGLQAFVFISRGGAGRRSRPSEGQEGGREPASAGAAGGSHGHHHTHGSSHSVPPAARETDAGGIHAHTHGKGGDSHFARNSTSSAAPPPKTLPSSTGAAAGDDRAPGSSAKLSDETQSAPSASVTHPLGCEVIVWRHVVDAVGKMTHVATAGSADMLIPTIAGAAASQAFVVPDPGATSESTDASAGELNFSFETALPSFSAAEIYIDRIGDRLQAEDSGSGTIPRFCVGHEVVGADGLQLCSCKWLCRPPPQPVVFIATQRFALQPYAIMLLRNFVKHGIPAVRQLGAASKGDNFLAQAKKARQKNKQPLWTVQIRDHPGNGIVYKLQSLTGGGKCAPLDHGSSGACPEGVNATAETTDSAVFQDAGKLTAFLHSRLALLPSPLSCRLINNNGAYNDAARNSSTTQVGRRAAHRRKDLTTGDSNVPPLDLLLVCKAWHASLTSQRFLARCTIHLCQDDLTSFQRRCERRGGLSSAGDALINYLTKFVGSLFIETYLAAAANPGISSVSALRFLARIFSAQPRRLSGLVWRDTTLANAARRFAHIARQKIAAEGVSTTNFRNGSPLASAGQRVLKRPAIERSTVPRPQSNVRLFSYGRRSWGHCATRISPEADSRRHDSTAGYLSSAEPRSPNRSPDSRSSAAFALSRGPGASAVRHAGRARPRARRERAAADVRATISAAVNAIRALQVFIECSRKVPQTIGISGIILDELRRELGRVRVAQCAVEGGSQSRGITAAESSFSWISDICFNRLSVHNNAASKPVSAYGWQVGECFSESCGLRRLSVSGPFDELNAVTLVLERSQRTLEYLAIQVNCKNGTAAESLRSFEARTTQLARALSQVSARRRTFGGLSNPLPETESEDRCFFQRLQSQRLDRHTSPLLSASQSTAAAPAVSLSRLTGGSRPSRPPKVSLPNLKYLSIVWASVMPLEKFLDRLDCPNLLGFKLKYIRVRGEEPAATGQPQSGGDTRSLLNLVAAPEGQDEELGNQPNGASQRVLGAYPGRSTLSAAYDAEVRALESFLFRTDDGVGLRFLEIDARAFDACFAAGATIRASFYQLQVAVCSAAFFAGIERTAAPKLQALHLLRVVPSNSAEPRLSGQLIMRAVLAEINRRNRLRYLILPAGTVEVSNLNFVEKLKITTEDSASLRRFEIGAAGKVTELLFDCDTSLDVVERSLRPPGLFGRNIESLSFNGTIEGTSEEMRRILRSLTSLKRVSITSGNATAMSAHLAPLREMGFHLTEIVSQRRGFIDSRARRRMRNVDDGDAAGEGCTHRPHSECTLLFQQSDGPTVRCSKTELLAKRYWASQRAQRRFNFDGLQTALELDSK